MVKQHAQKAPLSTNCNHEFAFAITTESREQPSRMSLRKRPHGFSITAALSSSIRPQP
jgi:hypothetical protein